MVNRIAFVQVGGTIDKDYKPGEENHGYNFEIGKPAFLRILKRAGHPGGLLWRDALRKDSLDMTDGDRLLVLSWVARSRCDRVVVTHGTDTIQKTAEVLDCIHRKVIVLTGSMNPEKFRNSDADFNLGMAVGAVQCLPYGVYIALYGKVVPWRAFVPR